MLQALIFQSSYTQPAPIDSSPVWKRTNASDNNWSQSYITDGTTHVTTVDITEYSGTNTIYSFKINDLGTTVPNLNVGAHFATLILTPIQRISEIKCWASPVSASPMLIYKVRILLNDGTTWTRTSTNGLDINAVFYIFTVPSG